MTSKEALKMLETRCRYFASDELEMKETYEAREVIKKDLEILEILKPYIEISSEGIISCHNLVLLPQCETYKEKYDLIKEWLENE